MANQAPPSSTPPPSDPGSGTTSSQYLGYANKDAIPKMGSWSRWGVPSFIGQQAAPGPGHLNPQYAMYKKGDPDLIASKITNPQQIQDIQDALVAAGYLSAYRAQTWDGPTREAFGKLLADSNVNGMPWQQYIGVAAAGAAASGFHAGGSKLGNYQLPVFDVKNTDDLKDVFKQVAEGTIGHYVSEEEVNSMVLSYQQMQIEKQREKFNLQRQQGEAQEAGTSGVGPETVLQDESTPEDWSRRWYEGAHPWQAAATKTTGAIEAALAFLRGGGAQQ